MIKKSFYILGLPIVFANTALIGNDITFDTLDVSGTLLGDDKKQFLTPGANSTVEGIDKSLQSIDSVVRSMPGSYTNTDQSQGTVSVNIRGMNSFGRVTTMIDGVPQTFFGTSSDNGKFHQGDGSNVGSSAFGAPIAQDFLVGVDISRGYGGNGIGGSNSLMGSANFRTISVDDLVLDGNIFGFMGRYSYGTNGIGPRYMSSIAAKKAIDNDSSLGILFGFSGRKISQDYKIGGGQRYSKQSSLSFNSNLGDEGDFEDTNVNAFNPDELTQRPKSVLFKTEYKPNSDSSLSFAYRMYKNSLAGRKFVSDTYQINYDLNPVSQLIDTKVLLAWTNSVQRYNEFSSIYGASILDLAGGKALEAKNNYFISNLSNTFSFEFDDFVMSHTFGFSHSINKYLSNKVNESNPFQPSGNQILSSGYIDSSFEYGLVSLGTNLNLSHWELSGYKPECQNNPACFPKNATNITKSGNYLNGSAVLSLNLHDLFKPFVSYSRTNRSPNVQEMFFTSEGGDSINPFLRPEKADTYQIGFNSYKQGIVSDDDVFGFKLVYYKTRIKDYIYNKRFYLETEDGSPVPFYISLNNQYPVNFKGIETELSYDIGYFYTKASYSRQYTDQPTNETDGSQNGGFGFTKLSELPRDYATLDVGARLLNKNLILGGIAKYTGKAKRYIPGTDEREAGNTSDLDLKEGTESPISKQELPKIPTIIDFYASYNLFKNFNIKFQIQNVFDKNYIDALNAYNSSESQTTYDANENNVYLFKNSARGRTFLVGFDYRY